MSPDSSTAPRADGDGTGPVPAKTAASLRGRAVLVVGCRGRMGAMLCRRGTAAGLDMRGVDVPLTDAVLAPACKDAALVLLCVPAAVFADVADDFLKFIKGAELIIHNAKFDVGFLNAELKRIGNNLNQIAQYFHSGGFYSKSMQDEINRHLTALWQLRQEAIKLGGTYHGRVKTHRNKKR